MTKNELQHLTILCKSEVDAMGRITAGVLKLLKLEQSIGRSTLDQLSNLGMVNCLEELFVSQSSYRCFSNTRIHARLHDVRYMVCTLC